MKILICDPTHEDAISYLKKQDVEVTYSPEIDAPALLEEVPKFEALFVRSRTKVTKDVIEAGKKLKFIGRIGSGTDNIDKEVAKKHCVTVVNAPGSKSQAAAEHTVALIFALLRHIPRADASMKQGKWLKKKLMGHELFGKTVGIIGHGSIGEKVGKLLSSFDVKMKIHDKVDTEENLSKLLSTSDIVSLHLVLTPETKNLINEERLGHMKKNAYLINTSRAEVIDEDALYNSLKSCQLDGAALDVFWQEPSLGKYPWHKLDNVILTPHIAGETHEAARAASMMVACDIIRFNKGGAVKNRVI